MRHYVLTCVWKDSGLVRNYTCKCDSGLVCNHMCMCESDLGCNHEFMCDSNLVRKALPDTAWFRHTNAHIFTHQYMYIQISFLPISNPTNMQMYLHFHNHTCKSVYSWSRWWRTTTWYRDISRPARFCRYIILGYVHICVNTHVQRHVRMYDFAAAFSRSEEPWSVLWCRCLSAYQQLRIDLICKTCLRA